MHIRCPRCHDEPYAFRVAGEILGQCARPGQYCEIDFTDDLDTRACPTCEQPWGSYIELVGLSTKDELRTLLPRRVDARGVLFSFSMYTPQKDWQMRRFAEANGSRFLTLAFDSGMLLALVPVIYPHENDGLGTPGNGVALWEPGDVYLANDLSEMIQLLEQHGRGAIVPEGLLLV